MAIKELARSKLFVLSILTLGTCIAIFVVKGPLEILDSKLFYFKSDLDLLFSLFTEEQKRTYLTINILDFIFMSLYTLLFLEVYKKSFPENEMYKTLSLVPLALLFFDSFETSIIFYFNLSYPNVSDFWKILLVISTPTKWFLALSSLLVVVNGFLLKSYLKNK